MSIEQNDKQRAESTADAVTDVKQAVESLTEFGEQVVYGAMAFGATVAIVHYGFDIEIHDAVEPAILNAGIAYYTHAATGRIIRALVILVRPAATAARAKVSKSQRVALEAQRDLIDRDSV